MKILALVRFLDEATPEKVKEFRKAEAEYVWKIYADDVLREMYFRTDKPGAVLILECESVAAAEDVLSKLPYVEQGVISCECIPLGHFKPFEALLGEDAKAS